LLCHCFKVMICMYVCYMLFNKYSVLNTTTTSFVDNAIDLPWRNFLSPEFVTKSQMEVR